MQGKLYQEAEEYITDIFWTESHNKNNTLNIEDVVGEKLIADEKVKDPEYYNQKVGVVHVTSLSKCLRGALLGMMGYHKDEAEDTQKLGVFKAGNLFEDFIVDSLGDKMLDRQTEYIFKYKNLIVTGRDDGTIWHGGERIMLENKSVHSDSFWHRKREGTLVAAHNQMQLQTYMWFRRILPKMFMINGTKEIIYTNMEFQELWEYKGSKPGMGLIEYKKPDESNLNGIFCYISKDDCAISSAPVKFNQNIIDQTVMPVIELLVEAYEKKDPNIIPIPDPVIFSPHRGQYQKNWIATWCDYHSQCAGKGWILEAQEMITQKNKEMKEKMDLSHTVKKVKPTIEVVKD